MWGAASVGLVVVMGLGQCCKKWRRKSSSSGAGPASVLPAEMEATKRTTSGRADSPGPSAAGPPSSAASRPPSLRFPTEPTTTERERPRPSPNTSPTDKSLTNTTAPITTNAPAPPASPNDAPTPKAGPGSKKSQSDKEEPSFHLMLTPRNLANASSIDEDGPSTTTTNSTSRGRAT